MPPVSNWWGVPWTEMATVGLTLVSLVVAVVAVLISVRANGKASEANRIAKAGNAIANRAVEDAVAAPNERGLG